MEVWGRRTKMSSLSAPSRSRFVGRGAPKLRKKSLGVAIGRRNRLPHPENRGVADETLTLYRQRRPGVDLAQDSVQFGFLNRAPQQEIPTGFNASRQFR